MPTPCSFFLSLTGLGLLHIAYAYYLLALYVKLTYALLIDLGCACAFTVGCLLLYFISFFHLRTLFYLLLTGYSTTYSSAAALTLQGLLALCSTALFLPYWQVLLTNSARLHCTSYCILLSNYYLFAYSYNTLNNTCLLTRIILVNLPRTVPYFLLSLYIHCTYFSIPFTSHCPLPTHKIKVFYDFYHECDLNHIYCDFFHL